MTFQEVMALRAKHKNDIDYCPKCGKIIEGQFYKKCLSCNCDLLPYTDTVPKCPTCSSIAVKKLSFANRYIHYRAIGFLSKTARSQFVCNNCGYKW